MWYISTRNGGQYSEVRHEFPAHDELQVMFNKAYAAKQQGFIVNISLWEGDWSHGHYSHVNLINDENLEEMHISYDYGYCYGNRKWTVRIYDPQTYEDLEVLHFEY